MTSDDKRRVRDEVSKPGKGWTIIWRCGDMPCEFIDEKVQLIFEDMDGNPCICDAVYTYDKNDSFYHRPFFKRRSDGSHMVNCIAWRKL